jgi:hypothetical protein
MARVATPNRVVAEDEIALKASSKAVEVRLLQPEQIIYHQKNKKVQGKQ